MEPRGMDETSWDVVEDLQFLLASDDQLHDELSYVCDLLCDSSDASPSPWDGHDESLSPLGANTRGGAATTTATEHAPKPKPKRIRAKVPTDQTSRARQQREMKELRLQVDRLKRQLVEVSYAQSQRDDASTWERAAHDENRHKNRSIQENDQLRAAVHEHTSLISEMTRVLRKKPRLTPQMDRTSEAWQSCRLAAHKALRVAAIHAIADKQLAMLQTKFIRAGVFDRPDDLIRARPLPQVNGSVIVEYVYHVTLAAPCHLVGDAVWNVFNGSAAAPGDCAGLVDGAVETYEFLDRTTLYRTFTKVRDEAASGRHAVNTAHSNALFKCYKQNDQVAIVWKSVLEDALMPHMTNGAVHDESGWCARWLMPTITLSL
ncbi:hypothetical protein, variant [Aphanomyces invadans]|uniref:Uncharacterized protein n=1 Tax=Aphanomyces invadans TaxID=157072 RepID=A0A024UHD4_9STRA|nr:hypothetical protein, variant [Aphanomyces invadans]ETW05282.1 hypothetical protein, variant [Aphanomyces invadans]|eukprot:XP_008866719.1 hypothetical protein, variant [Aphanomyces invadans]